MVMAIDSKPEGSKGDREEKGEKTGKNGGEEQQVLSSCIARYNDMTVYVKRIPVRLESYLSSRQLASLMQDIKQLSHPNINRFIGICSNPNDTTGTTTIVHLYCRRGGLSTMLVSGLLDWDLRFSLAKDLAEAVHAIHRSPLKYHGNIKTSKCLVDEYFGLKLTDLATEKLLIMGQSSKDKKMDTGTVQHTQWTAPELVRGEPKTSACDIYSYGMVAGQLLETIITHNDRNAPEEDQMEFTFTEELEGLINRCTHVTPAERPNTAKLILAFKKCARSQGHAGSLFDVMMNRLERHAAALEELVRDRMVSLAAEMERCDGILRQILPREVVITLRQGGTVRPEIFDQVSVMFTDVDGWIQFVAEVTPFEIVNFLHEMYSAFDIAVAQFKVYKVETIGHSYMVVAGLPESLGDQHASEICRLALHLQTTFAGIQNEHGLELRTGVHSGSVAAGVVGFRQPRYCLFGDVVNTSSRMLSTGEPSKCQLSEYTAALLSMDEFRLEKRGQIEVKGKGVVSTYWLLPQTGAEER